MTKNEIKLFVEAVFWYKRQEDSNPEVGMGSFVSTMIEHVSERVGIFPDETEFEFIENEIYRLLPRS